MINYLKRFEAWAIALRERYTNDLFFHTSLNVIFVSAGFVLVCIAAFALSSWLPAVSWYIYVGILLSGTVFWVMLVRVMVRPARDTLHYQKLFISNIAHELRTPLSTIKTSTEVELLDERITGSLRRTLGDTLGELDRISEIINNLLSLNVLNRPGNIEFTTVDCMPLLEGAVKRLAPLARERDIRITVKKKSEGRVWGSAKALEQVMTHLIKNAVIYTPKGGGRISVSIHPDQHGSIVFSVADTGVGIPPKDLFHIFEPFYRVDMSRTRNVRKVGSGLGLMIVNEIVRAHHGKINMQSTLGQGTTVSVQLPSGVEPEVVLSHAERSSPALFVWGDLSAKPSVPIPSYPNDARRV